jgi:hypothetical protein
MVLSVFLQTFSVFGQHESLNWTDWIPRQKAVEYDLFGILIAAPLTPEEFTINGKGGCRLNPQMAKSLVSTISRLDGRVIIRDFLKQIKISRTEVFCSV